MNFKFLLTLFILSVGFFTLVEFASATEGVVIKQATLPASRSHLACAEDSSTHKIYCFGGEPYTNQIFEYNSLNDVVVVKNAGLPGSRLGLSCAEDSSTHKIYCFGGYDGSALNQITEYDPATDTLVPKTATLPVPKYYFDCTEDSSTHKIYCFGGTNSGNQIVEYNPNQDIVTIKQATLPNSRQGLSCEESLINHKIYCFGGEPHTTEIIEYIPLTDTLSIKNAILPTARAAFDCAPNVYGNIYCFGGSESSGNRLSQIVEYEPSTDLLNVRPFTLPMGGLSALACARNSMTHQIYCFGGELPYSDQIIEYTSPYYLIDTPRLLNPPRIGTTLDIELSDSSHPNTDYLLAMSLGNAPGMTLSDNRNIPLNYDLFLQTSLFSPFSLSLFNSQSRFNSNGIGSAFWNIPNNPGLAGQDLYFGFVTVDLHNPLPQAILSISQSRKVKIMPRHFISDSNTVALWNFDENMGDVLTDFSGNGNNGQVRGASWTTGIDGSALHFDGVDDYVNVSDSPSLVLTNAFTIEAYVNFEGTLQDTSIDTIVGKDYQYIFGIGDNVFPNNLAFTFADQPGSLCPNTWCDGVATVPQNSWHHVAVQYDGQTIKTIMDGQIITEYPAQFTVGSASTTLGIGARLVFALDTDPVPVAFFKGKIDEVRISTIARY